MKSAMERPLKPRVFFDADVLIAGSASTRGASYILLHLAELTIIEGIISEQVKVEAERNLREKLPQALPAFRVLVGSALKVVPDPAEEELGPYRDQADEKDVPILAAAVREKCHYLLTFNTRHYYPAEGVITVSTPGEFLSLLRRQLSELVESREA